jgi:hypothetical protein
MSSGSVTSRTRTNRWRQLTPFQQALCEHRGTFWIVADPCDGGTDEEQEPPAGWRDVVGEAAHDTLHVLELVPPRDLHDERVVRTWQAVGRNLGRALHRTRAAVAADIVHRPGRGAAVEHADLGEDPADRVLVQVLVLRGEWVDRRRDDRDLLARNPGRHVFAPGEDEAARVGQIGPQHVPRRGRRVVLPVDPDVAAPGHLRSGLRQALGKPGGLRIVQQDQVAWPDQLEQLGSVRREHPLIVADLLGCERTAKNLAVDLVVQPLEDDEDRRPR